jgi:hypothetical protein
LDELQGQESGSRLEHELCVDVERDTSEDWVQRTDGQLQGEIGVRRDNDEADLGSSVSVSEAIEMPDSLHDSMSHLS